MRHVSLIILFLLLAISPAQAQQQLTPILHAIDVETATFPQKISQFQSSYVNQLGKGNQYYQMLWSHTTLPTDGVSKIADGLASKPTDRIDDGLLLWQFLKASSTNSTYRMRVDNYDGPEGKGYMIIYQVEVQKGVWQKSINFGPETHRDRDWHMVLSEDDQ